VAPIRLQHNIWKTAGDRPMLFSLLATIANYY